MPINYRRAVTTVCVGLAVLASPASALAPAPRTTVTIILKESFPDTSLQAVVRREPGPAGHDIIAIRRSQLSPGLLFAALKALDRAKSRHGEQPSRTVNIKFMRVRHYPALSSSEEARMRNILRRLESTKAVKVPRIKGLVRSIEVPLT